jgi:hypothetical protein
MSDPTTLDLSAYLKNQERTVEVKPDDETSFKAKYNAALFDDELYKEVLAISPLIKTDPFAVIPAARRIVVKVVTDLGITVGATKMSVTEANVAKLPPLLVLAIIAAVMKDQTPGNV